MDTTIHLHRAISVVLALGVSAGGCAPLVYRYHAEGVSLDAGTVACVVPKREVVLHEIRRGDGTAIDGGPWGGDAEIYLPPGDYTVAVSFTREMGGVGVVAVEPVTAELTLRGGCVHVIDARIAPHDQWRPEIDVRCQDTAGSTSGA
jgi:hypothetical protein